MPEVDRRNVEMLREEYERQVASFREMHLRASQLSGTAVSPRRELSVTVGPQGAITELKFLTSSYRKMAKNELSELVTRTVAEAQDDLYDQIAEVMAPMLPPELNPKDVVTGRISADKLGPDESRMPELLRELMDRRT